MFKLLRGSREGQAYCADANRIVAKTSEWGEPRCVVDPMEEFVRHSRRS